jgi:hypothetical protein
MPEPLDPGAVAEGAVERIAEREADVLDRVVRVDVQVTLGRNLQVDHAVTRHLIQHMVEKRHAGRQFGRAGAIQVKADADLGFTGVARDRGSTHLDNGADKKPILALKRQSRPRAFRARRAGPPGTACFLPSYPR